MNCTYDYLTFENPEAITLSRGGQTIPTAYRIAVGTKEQVPSHGVALTQNPDWLVPQILLTESPQIGDIITDGSGFQWVILRQQAPICLGCWICNCVRLALSDLADTIQIYASTETNGVGGDRLLTQGTKLFDGQARIQPTTAQVMELWGTVDMWRQYNIYLLSDVEPPMGSYVVCGAQTYDIISWESHKTLDNFDCLKVVRKGSADV